MAELTSNSWAALGFTAAALVLSVKIAALMLPVVSVALGKRYFRSLVPATNDDRDDIGEYAAEARVLAMGEKFEFVNTYVWFRGPMKGRIADVWRAEDFKTIAVVAEGRPTESAYGRTRFVSVTGDGDRLTTTDNVLVGDPRGFEGAVAWPGMTFRELHYMHKQRIAAANSEPVTIGDIDPVSAIEDLERQHVQQLVSAGLARYRNKTQTAWSYTLRGGYEIHSLANSNRFDSALANLATRADHAAE